MSTLRTDNLQPTDQSILIPVAGISTDKELRQDLANSSDLAKGAELVGYQGGTVAGELAEINNTLAGLGQSGALPNLAREAQVNRLARYDAYAHRLVGKALLSGFYDHFGLMDLLPTGELCMSFRRGTTHETDNGKIMFCKLLPTGGWGAPVTIVEQAGLDFRDAAGGVMRSGRVIVATTSYDITGPTFPDIRIYASDDYGSTWTLKQSIPKGTTNYRFVHGKGCQIGDKYVIPYYTQTGSTNALRLLETTDNGETWTEGATIYSGAVTYNEAGIVSLGGGWVLAVSRIGPGSGGLLRQFLSTDGGATWTDQGNVTSQNADASDTLVSPSLAYIVSDSGTPHVALFYTDRTTAQLVYRTIPVAAAIAGVTGWSGKRSVYSAPNLSGYQSHVVIGKRVLGNFFRETTPNAVAGAYQWEAYLGDLPDYESDWTAVTASTQYQFAHGLQRPPRRVVVEYAASSDPNQTFIVGASYFNDGTHKGSGAQVAISGTNVTVGTGAAVWGTSYFAGIDGAVGNRVTSGFYRVRAWL